MHTDKRTYSHLHVPIFFSRIIFFGGVMKTALAQYSVPRKKVIKPAN